MAMIRPIRFRVIGYSTDKRVLFIKHELEWGGGGTETMYSTVTSTPEGLVPSEMTAFVPMGCDVAFIGPWCDQIEKAITMQLTYQF